MNKNLENAIFDMEKVNGLMHVIESSLTTLEVAPEVFDQYTSSTYAFYALWDSIEKVREDLDKLRGDAKVVDVIRAAKESRI